MAAAHSRTRQESSHSANKRGSAAPSRLNVYGTPLPLCIDEATLLYSIAWLLHASVQKLSYALLARAPSRNIIPETGYLPQQIYGYWDEATASVWILPRRTRKKVKISSPPQEASLSAQGADNGDESEMHDMQVMWTKGFFGKGSLSRSEPTWWQREKNRVSGQHVLTAEDVTAQRRADRKVHKAKKAQERLDEREKQATAMLATQDPQQTSSTPDAAVNDRPNDGAAPPEVVEQGAGNDVASLQTTAVRPRHTKTKPGKTQQEAADQAALLASLGIQVLNKEHVQLQREEAMFLSFGIGVLQITKPSGDVETSTCDSTALSLAELWQTFCQASLPVPSRFESFQHSMLRPDNPFILSYVIYHHYRSLGWVVRNGIKFCVDWILYKGADGVARAKGGAGPVGGHAEFAVVVIPTYEDPADAPSEGVLNHRRDWTWLNTVNRVCAGVKKTVILAYIRIPAMVRMHSDGKGAFSQLFNPGCLDLYEVREVALKRFIPSRMRD